MVLNRFLFILGGKTLDIFEHEIERLTEVPDIAKKKLASIEKVWQENRAAGAWGISTCFHNTCLKKMVFYVIKGNN